MTVSKNGWGLLKNTNLRRPLALRNPRMTRIVSLQIGLFQQARMRISDGPMLVGVHLFLVSVDGLSNVDTHLYVKGRSLNHLSIFQAIRYSPPLPVPLVNSDGRVFPSRLPQ